MTLRFLLWISACSVFAACASIPKKPMDDGIDASAPRRHVLSDVPFLPQDSLQCGPTSLAMVLNHHNDLVTVKELEQKVFTASGGGSLQSDMIGGARRQGYMAHVVKSFSEVVQEVHAGRPVVVFTNQALSWFPQWHYAVVVGYDFGTQTVYMHSGPDRLKEESYTTFAYQWDLAERWALVIYPASENPETGRELDRMSSAAALESIGKKEQAMLAYQMILKKWPESLGAMIGLGNIYYSSSRFPEAVQILAEAKRLHPKSRAAQNNYEVALAGLKKTSPAKASSK